MVEFIQALQQCWKTHGWGTFQLDPSHSEQGFLIVKIANSLFAKTAPKSKRPACFLEAGILSSFFSKLTGRELHCVQTSCESLGSDCNRFILGLRDRLQPADSLVEEGQDHEAIITQLCQSN